MTTRDLEQVGRMIAAMERAVPARPARPLPPTRLEEALEDLRLWRIEAKDCVDEKE